MTHVSKLAKASIDCSIFGGSINEITNSSQKIIAEGMLIIGGDIEGIQAAPEIAHCNHKVCLLERKGTVGGHWAISNRTISTFNCAVCFLTPKIAKIEQKSVIEPQIYSEVLQLRN